MRLVAQAACTHACSLNPKNTCECAVVFKDKGRVHGLFFGYGGRVNRENVMVGARPPPGTWIVSQYIDLDD
jgi:hypothetical protein